VPNAVLRAKENHAKVYQVTTRYDLYEEELQQLRNGVVITTLAQRDGRRAQELTAPTLPCEVEWGPYANTVLVTLREVGWVVEDFYAVVASPTSRPEVLAFGQEPKP